MQRREGDEARSRDRGKDHVVERGRGKGEGEKETTQNMLEAKGEELGSGKEVGRKKGRGW